MTLKFVDLFAGVGGFRLGLEACGMECVFSSENDRFACITYNANHGEYPAGDITEIKAKDIPDFNILTAGFPCQPFSTAGNHKGIADKRGRLFEEILRIADYKKPEMLLLENVPATLTLHNGKVKQYLLDGFDSIDYDVRYEILKSSDFGLPQRRRRVFFVATRKDISIESFEFPEPFDGAVDAQLIMLDESEIPEEFIVTNPRYLYDYRPIFNTIDASYHKGFGRNTGRVCIIQHLDIGARYSGICSQKDGKYSAVQDNIKVRRLVPREFARLQGFPDDFIIPVSKTQAYRQFGNAVSVPVVTAIGKQIIKFFK